MNSLVRHHQSLSGLSSINSSSLWLLFCSLILEIHKARAGGGMGDLHQSQCYRRTTDSDHTLLCPPVTDLQLTETFGVGFIHCAVSREVPYSHVRARNAETAAAAEPFFLRSSLC